MRFLEPSVPRIYLFVPPEEKDEVQALGANWDVATKRWYIDTDVPLAQYARWLPDADTGDSLDEEHTMVSRDAYVVAAGISCPHCHTVIQVICIHCESGLADGRPLERFTLSDVWAIDESLARQLELWPHYHKVLGPAEEGDRYANHCPWCKSVIDDMYLHSEPDQPFFDIPGAAPGTLEITPLTGAIRLSGDEHFRIG
jgi:hypothetical protein